MGGGSQPLDQSSIADLLVRYPNAGVKACFYRTAISSRAARCDRSQRVAASSPIASGSQIRGLTHEPIAPRLIDELMKAFSAT
jgi:hypothetical protein